MRYGEGVGEIMRLALPARIGFRASAESDMIGRLVKALASWGGSVALFVLIVVGLVVGQTWLDWRDSMKGWIVPDWAKGIALGGVIAVSLAAAASFASVWLRDAAAQVTGGVVSWRFWMELGLLLAMMGIIVLASHRKRVRVVLFIVCLIAGILWFGMIL